MSKSKETVKHANGSIEYRDPVPDELPSPRELAEAEESVKVTLSLSKYSVEYFKEAALKNNASYQKMIRRLLDEYVQRQEQVARGRIRRMLAEHGERQA